MTRLTSSLLNHLETLRRLTAELGRPPTLRALVEAVGSGSLSYTCRSLQRLGRLGFVEKRQGKWWPAEVLLLTLTPEEAVFLNRGLATVEEAIHQIICREMTSDARAHSVLANPQEEPHARRKAEDEEVRWDRF